MFDMEDRLLEQIGYVRVVQRVHDGPTVPLADDETEVAEDAQLVRDGRGLHLYCGRQVVHRPIAEPELAEDAHAARRGECLHGLGNR